MNFVPFFKITTMLVLSVGGDIEATFMPLLESCSKAYDCGDVETASSMLDFISSGIVKLLDC